MDMEKLTRWYQLKQSVSQLQAEEQALRQQIFSECFPNAVAEGTAYLELADGFKLKGQSKLNRTVVQAAVANVPKKIRDALFKSKFELNLKAYRGLEALDEKSRKLVDLALTIKPGLPTLEIVPPAEEK